MGNLYPENEQRPETSRLGFHEIVPGDHRDVTENANPEIDIPEFDLGRRLMVEERRESAARRQGPGKRQDVAQEDTPAPPVTHAPEESHETFSVPGQVRVSVYRHPVIQRHALVEEIVQRDIQRLCMAS